MVGVSNDANHEQSMVRLVQALCHPEGRLPGRFRGQELDLLILEKDVPTSANFPDRPEDRTDPRA